MERPWQGGTLGEMISQMADQYGKVVREELLDEKGILDNLFLMSKATQIDPFQEGYHVQRQHLFLLHQY